jgi:hypothetical protein
MEAPIFNKVANSPLITVDLEMLKTEGTRAFIDIAQWLEEGIILREKSFRAALKKHHWEQYKNQHIALGSSADAILPAWASLLVATHLNPFAKTIVMGSLEDLEKQLFSTAILQLDLETFKGKPLMIKGCTDASIPEAAYVALIQHLQPIAKSLFYGEACSSVPLWKAKPKRES